MTKDDIARMARESGGLPDPMVFIGAYERFANLVAAHKALEQPKQEPSQWRDMVVVSLVREGINKHKARELADHFATPPAAQRPWQGLTDKDVNKESAMIAAKMKLVFHAGMYVAQNILKERNT